MATYNPPADLFARQIESIKQQTHHEWICVISDGGSTPEAIGALKKAIGDDARFQLSISESRLGVYDNFERALLMVPAAANYVAFCDQDDYWRSDKLDALLAGLEPGSLLVYSDARIVDAQGHIIDETLWRAGPIDHAEFASLMLTTRGNIPGAAMLFDATLLEDALPFPPGYPGWYHDFWMSRLAATLGPLSYVDAPLYDYVQHEHQTLGASRDRTGESTSKRIAPLGGKAMHPSWRRYLYFDDFLRVLLASQTLEVRCAGRMSRDRVRTLKAVADSPRGITWLVLRGARHWFGAANTRRAERNILEGFMWRRCADLRKRSRQRASLRRRYW